MKRSTIHERYFLINKFLLKLNTVRSTFAVFSLTNCLVLKKPTVAHISIKLPVIFFNFSSILVPFCQLEFKQWRRPILKTKTKCYPYSTNTGCDNKIEALFVQASPVTTKSNAKQNRIHTSTSSS